MALQIGIRLHDTKELPIDQRLKNAKADGFDCVHIAISKTAVLLAEMWP